MQTRDRERRFFLSASVRQLVLDDVEIPTNCSEERREFWPTTLLTERVAFAWFWRVFTRSIVSSAAFWRTARLPCDVSGVSICKVDFFQSTGTVLAGCPVCHYQCKFYLPATCPSCHPTVSACRRLEKLVLPSIFDTSFILDDVKLAELSNKGFE